MAAAKFITVWQFDVKPEFTSRFEEIYGAEGEWARLFRSSGEYDGTLLVRDMDNPRRFLTIDRWTTRESLRQFKQDHHSEYQALDQRCETLTELETFRGDFEIV